MESRNDIINFLLHHICYDYSKCLERIKIILVEVKGIITILN